EDGIRGFHVTGVQMCALPILYYLRCTGGSANIMYTALPCDESGNRVGVYLSKNTLPSSTNSRGAVMRVMAPADFEWTIIPQVERSEERREGKVVGSGQRCRLA